MVHPHLEILELSSLKLHSLILGPIFCKSAIVIFRQPFKMFDSNNFTLSSMFSFQNAWPIKRKAVYTFSLVHFHMFIQFPVRIGSDHNLHCIFFKNNLFNFSKPSSSSKR